VYIQKIKSFNPLLRGVTVIHFVRGAADIDCQMHHLYKPNANLSRFQRSTFYAGIQIFNSRPRSLTVLKNEKAKFK
jgi:hypothetical protein